MYNTKGQNDEPKINPLHSLISNERKDIMVIGDLKQRNIDWEAIGRQDQANQNDS